MNILFLILVLVHGLIHLLGFVKGFGLKEVKELSLPISKQMGVVWLATALLFMAYGVLHLLNYRYAWLIGFAAVVSSQLLVILFWKDARFGTIPNIIILTVLLCLMSYYNFKKHVQQETEQLLGKNASIQSRSFNEGDLIGLPAPVVKWLQNSGAVGKPFIHVGKVTQLAKMKMKPEQDKWMTARAVQYTTIDNPAFIWTVDVKMNSVLTFQGRDKFENGKGEMLIKLNSLFNIVDAEGEKMDEGSLQRF